MRDPDTLTAELKSLKKNLSEAGCGIVLQMKLHDGSSEIVEVYHIGEDYLACNDVILTGEGKKIASFAHDSPRYISFASIYGFQIFHLEGDMVVNWGR